MTGVACAAGRSPSRRYLTSTRPPSGRSGNRTPGAAVRVSGERASRGTCYARHDLPSKPVPPVLRAGAGSPPSRRCYDASVSLTARRNIDSAPVSSGSSAGSKRPSAPIVPKSLTVPVPMWLAARPLTDGFALWYGTSPDGIGPGSVIQAGNFEQQAQRATAFLRWVYDQSH
jgi:hypothetical protein